MVTICLPDPDAMLADLNSGSACRVWARSISQGGLAFIYPHEIPNGPIVVRIMISGQRESLFLGKIVRSRKIAEEDFWEHGVAFCSRVDT